MMWRLAAPGRLWLLAGVLLLAAVTWGLLRGPSTPQAPEVTYRLLDGTRLSNADLRGRHVLVNFWSTTCRVCIREMPAVARLHRDFAGQAFTVIAVAMAYDPPNAVLEYVERAALPFPVALDWDGRTAAAFGGVTGTPLSFLIDAEGRILERQEGEIDIERLRRLLRRRG